MSYLIALMTAPNMEDARSIARTLVEERLAACCNIIDRVESIYRWDGAVEEAAEVLVVIKTTDERFAAMSDRVAALHPYDVPELVALPVTAGSAPYLAWLAASVL